MRPGRGLAAGRRCSFLGLVSDPMLMEQAYIPGVKEVKIKTLANRLRPSIVCAGWVGVCLCDCVWVGVYVRVFWWVWLGAYVGVCLYMYMCVGGCVCVCVCVFMWLLMYVILLVSFCVCLCVWMLVHFYSLFSLLLSSQSSILSVYYSSHSSI